jgi:hypothetical protein
MPLIKLQFVPGIKRESTNYANEGGWWDCDKVRFRQGYPEKIGGWVKFSQSAMLGTTRAIHPWISLDANEYVGFGTNLKYYVFGSGEFNDITPLRETTAAGDVTFAVGYTTISADIDATQDIIPITSSTNFPTTGGTIKIGDEIITYATRSGTNLLGAVRGDRGTTAASHLSGAAVGSSTVIVSDPLHGANLGDFVTFSGAASLGGNITADVLNQEYEIKGIISTAAYTVCVRDVSSIASVTGSGGTQCPYVFSNGSDSGSGGASAVGAYQINVGLDTQVFGSGWGAGPWSRGGWGSAADVAVAGAQLRIWTHDNYGGDLIINVRDGGIYYWEREPSYQRAVPIYTMVGAQSAPRLAKQVLVSDNDRHVVAFGCDDEFNPGVMDPLLIRFSSQENFLEWRSLPTTTAGSIRVGSGSTIVCAVETKQQTLVFTDVSLHAMQYLGPPFTFGLSMLSDNISIASPNAAVGADDAVYWMGQGDFYSYNGVVAQLPCDVKDYVFSNLNTDQFEKVYGGVNPAYGEVWWFYPSANSLENDSYVVYNYQQRIWYYGTMGRTAWTHRNQGVYPIACGTDNYVYTHEVGADDGSVSPPAPVASYIESSGQDIGEGDQFAFMWRVIPDITFRTSTGSPTATFTIKASNFPGADFSQSDPRIVAKTSSMPVEQFTNQLYVRVRGRSFAFRIDSADTGVLWRLGAPRVDIRTDGKR